MMGTAMLFLASFLCLGLLAYAQLSPLGNFPLAVKTPYLHSWILSDNQTAPGSKWPNMFTQSKTLGWNGMIRVDGKPYQWLGNAVGFGNDSTTLVSAITPTRTIFTIQTGPMKFNVTFFSPIEPNDFTRQSVPFTYLFVDGFTATDAMPHTIQLYSDITAEWVTKELTTPVIWDTNVASNMVYHHVQSRDPQQMVENYDVAEDSTGYYAAPQESFRSGLTWQAGAHSDCRGGFSKNGSLTNTKDTAFRAVNDSWPVFSFAVDLGLVTPNNPPPPVVWALGLVRNPLVNYATEQGFQPRMAYYWSSYQTIDDVISGFLGDFTDARGRGQTFDDRTLNAALQISSHYAEILSLVTRQVFASMDITIPASAGGQPNASDVKIFMKDISVSTRANPVEVIYAALPALIYFNSSFVRGLLDPLLEFQSSSKYPNHYASPDLGNIYPTISGNTDATEKLAIEHCGNMLIMAYAHASKTGDTSLVSKYHSLLQKWADYLIPNSLHPTDVETADGFNYSETSSLALKGIVGIYSMGKINEMTMSSNTTFKDKANELIKNWTQTAALGTHIELLYNKAATWGLMYNLFPAVWLQTGLISEDLLSTEAQYYRSSRPGGNESYSLDNEDGDGTAYPHWALMTAAIMPSDVRDKLIDSTYIQAFNSTRIFPLPMRYEASTGAARPGFRTGSAALGAAYGILAMQTEFVNANPAGPGDSAKKIPVGGIVGGVIGGLAFLLIVASGVLFWRRRREILSQIGFDPRNEKNPQLQPFLTPYAPVNIADGEFQFPGQDPAAGFSPLRNPRPESLQAERPYPDDSGRNQQPITMTTTPPVTSFHPLSSKQREILQQNQSHRYQPSDSAVSSSTNPNSSSGAGREDALRAEVDELRREMEAIRYVAQPPPSYQ